MTLVAYAVRRTIGAAIVFLIVVLLTMFALASVDTPPLRGPWRVPELDEVLRRWGDGWASFPAFALAAIGLLAGLVVSRRRLRR